MSRALDIFHGLWRCTSIIGNFPKPLREGKLRCENAVQADLVSPAVFPKLVVQSKWGYPQPLGSFWALLIVLTLKQDCLITFFFFKSSVFQPRHFFLLQSVWGCYRLPLASDPQVSIPFWLHTPPLSLTCHVSMLNNLKRLLHPRRGGVDLKPGFTASSLSVLSLSVVESRLPGCQPWWLQDPTLCCPVILIIVSLLGLESSTPGSAG